MPPCAKVAGQYAYDNTENDTDELTLRDGRDEINKQLEEKLDERLEMAGIEIVGSTHQLPRLCSRNCSRDVTPSTGERHHFSTRKIVEGAVSMVKMVTETVG